MTQPEFPPESSVRGREAAFVSFPSIPFSLPLSVAFPAPPLFHSSFRDSHFVEIQWLENKQMRAQRRSGIPHARPYEEHLTCGWCLCRKVQSSFLLKHTAYTSLPADSYGGVFLSLPRHHKVFIIHVWGWPEVVLYWTQKRYTHVGCLFWMGFCALKVSGTADA